MRVIIAGTRTFNDWEKFKKIMEAFQMVGSLEITEVVSGHCPTGVDQLGERWAKKHKLDLVMFPANWEGRGPSAGPKRNEKMAAYADALILIWDGQSRGSASMKREMEKTGKKICEIRIK